MKRVFLLLVAVVAISSCSMQKKIVYLQDQVINTELETIKGGEIRFQPSDIISIFVNSKNPELAAIFNMPRVQRVVGSAQASDMSGYNGTLNYTIDSDGYIDFPVLGRIKAFGLTKRELANSIKQMILQSEMIKDPIVTVEYANLTFSALGEVSRPGSFNIIKEKTTVLEALSMAGDLTINGVRDRVYLTRRTDNKQITYHLDLKTSAIYNSPAFYIQQNDVIYVEPNRTRANQSTLNGNTVRSTSFWFSLISALTTIAVLITK